MRKRPDAQCLRELDRLRWAYDDAREEVYRLDRKRAEHAHDLANIVRLLDMRIK